MRLFIWYWKRSTQFLAGVVSTPFRAATLRSSSTLVADHQGNIWSATPRGPPPPMSYLNAGHEPAITTKWTSYIIIHCSNIGKINSLRPLCRIYTNYLITKLSAYTLHAQVNVPCFVFFFKLLYKSKICLGRFIDLRKWMRK